jgi:hypothetical protein
MMFRCLRLRATWHRESTSNQGAAAAFAMISKCANPKCPRQLMRLDGGRFFGFAAKDNRIENFWLCANCSKLFTLRQIEGRLELLLREKKSA